MSGDPVFPATALLPRGHGISVEYLSARDQGLQEHKANTGVQLLNDGIFTKLNVMGFEVFGG